MFALRNAGLLLAGLCLCAARSSSAETFTENFSTDPAARGWAVYGASDLFQWNAAAGDLEVTWDSTRTNSYFYRPLGRELTVADEFSLGFDLRFSEITAGSFQVAIGLMNVADASKAGFLRGTGSDSPNLAEFDYFPDYNSMDGTVSGTNGAMQFVYDDKLPLNVGTTYRVMLTHSSGDPFLRAAVYQGGQLYSALPLVYTNTSFTDFRVDTMAVMSYSGVNGWGSVSARGTVDNIAITVPPILGRIAGGSSVEGWVVRTSSQAGYLYTLERTGAFDSWETLQSKDGDGTELTLVDTNPPPARAFYRVRAAAKP